MYIEKYKISMGACKTIKKSLVTVTIMESKFGPSQYKPIGTYMTLFFINRPGKDAPKLLLGDNF